MPLLPLGLARIGAALVLLIGPAPAEPLVLTVTPMGSAVASGRPLPVGAMPGLAIALRNGGTTPLGPVELTARADGLALETQDGWRVEDGALRTRIQSIAPGAEAERTLRLRVERAPLAAAAARVSVQAQGPDGRTLAGEAWLRIADCAGAYRERLAALRADLVQPARDAAEDMRRSDPALPATRLFPATGAKAGNLARAERLAAGLATRGGADMQLSTEWFRFLLARWASELNAYAGQAANPGLCASNEVQIAGYRQGLAPITRHVEATRAVAESALAHARREAEMADAGIDEIVRALAGAAGIESAAERAGALAALADVRAALRGQPAPAPELLRKLSLAETAAWLAEADTRGERLARAIEQVLEAIAAAHRESCVCAF